MRNIGKSDSKILDDNVTSEYKPSRCQGNPGDLIVR